MMEGQEKGPVRIVGHCLYVHLPKNYVLNATLSVFCCLSRRFIVSITCSASYTYFPAVSVKCSFVSCL